VSGLTTTHKNFWECDTGIAYLVSGDLARAEPLQVGPSGWRTGRMTKIYDLRDPAWPQFIRDFGLAGQEPGSTGPVPVAQGVHGPIVLGDCVYFAYGTSNDGLLQIVDRQKLLAGPPAPTAANLNAPEISRLWMSPNWGGHTAFPVLGMKIADWQVNSKGQTRDFVVLVSEAIANECQESRHASFMVDITTETRPFSVATFQVPESKGALLQPGWPLRAALEQRVVRADLLPQAGVPRLLQRRRARRRHPRSVLAARGRLLHPGHDRADRRALRDERYVRVQGRDPDQQRRADERGFVYLADRAGTGLHIVRVTGEAAKIVAGH
jgi:hypothetical protein